MHQKEQEWHPLIDNELRTQTLSVAHVIVKRMSTPETFLAAVELTSRQTLKQTMAWNPASLTFGFAGVALSYYYFAQCFPTESWMATAHHYLRLAAQGTHTTPMSSASLLDGMSGFAAVITLLSNNGLHYRKTVNMLHTQVQRQVIERLWKRRGTGGIALEDYDLITGATGILAYLLTLPSPDEQSLSLIQKLATYLIDVATIDPQSRREGWYVPPDLFAVEWQREHYPHGYLNCGMAHGIAGPLAVLAKTWQQGYRFPRLRNAIVTISGWLVEHALSDPWGINWPYVIPFQNAQTPDIWKTLPLAHASWCSGAPGISRALWLAGVALKDEALCQIAVEAIEAVLHRLEATCNIDTPTLCHGVGGLLTICLHFAHETENKTVCEHIPRLVTQILDAFNPDFPLGFRDREGAKVRPEGNVSVDHPGWLEGVQGTTLALLAAATSISPDWDRYLLIS